MEVAVLHAPVDFASTLGPLPERVTLRSGLRTGQPIDMIIGFITDRSHLEANFARLAAQLPVDGAFWVAWPKKASNIETDMSDEVIREVVLPTGWVDVKVCAIDAQWSALKVVLRKEMRTTAH